jgi:hypothetical protein
MPNAVDTFRALREEFKQTNETLKEFFTLATAVRRQIDGLSLNAELRAALRDEKEWLEKAQSTVVEVRRWREQERQRFWFALFWRWMLACAFALLAAWVAGAGYARATRRYAEEIQILRPKAELADLIQRRLADLTPRQRQEFDRLMRLPADPKR